MEQIVHRLENLYRFLRAAPQNACVAPGVAEAVAACLRDLHAIAAQTAELNPARPRLRLIDCAAAGASSAQKESDRGSRFLF